MNSQLSTLVETEESPKALVLGGATGMLGQALMKEGKKQGWEMLSLDRSHGDITDINFLEKQISTINPQYIFNTIAYTAVDLAEEEVKQATLINKTLPENLACLLRNSSIHCIHYSTDFVFNGKKTTPYVETDSTDPLSVYGSTKLAGEIALAKLDNVAILRTAWLFGAGRKNFISTIINAARTNPVLKVVHDQVGSPSSTTDVADISFTVAKNKSQGIYHAVNSGYATWCELADEAINIMNISSFVQPITSAEWPQKATRPKYSVLSTEKFTTEFNLPIRPWAQALREYIYENLMD